MKTKIKNIRKTILMLMGGATLISLPLAITSCSADNWKWKTYSFKTEQDLVNFTTRLIVSKTDTKTIHTQQEYASFYYNDLTNTNLFLSFGWPIIYGLAVNAFSHEKKLKFSAVMEEHKFGVKAKNTGPWKKIEQRVDFSKDNFISLKYEGEVGSTSSIPDIYDTHVSIKDFPLLNLITINIFNSMLTDPPLGVTRTIDVKLPNMDGNNDEDVKISFYILQLQFPNYTFQTNN